MMVFVPAQSLNPHWITELLFFLRVVCWVRYMFSIVAYLTFFFTDIFQLKIQNVGWSVWKDCFPTENTHKDGEGSCVRAQGRVHSLDFLSEHKQLTYQFMFRLLLEEHNEWQLWGKYVIFTFRGHVFSSDTKSCTVNGTKWQLIVFSGPFFFNSFFFFC